MMKNSINLSTDSSNRLAIAPITIDIARFRAEERGSDTSSKPLEMKVSETRAERAAAFRLVHQMYLEAGLTTDNPMHMRVMKHHLLDSTEVLVAKKNDDVCFTVTLVRDGQIGLPADSLFADEINVMRSSGINVAEVSCLAGAWTTETKRQRCDTLVKMLGLAATAAKRRGVDRLLLAVHPRHAKVYERWFSCIPCTEVKQYDAVEGNPAVLCMHDFAELDRQGFLFQDEAYGDGFRPWQLDGTRMSEQEKRFFRAAVNLDASEFVPMAA